jgi:hypothetical protein
MSIKFVHVLDEDHGHPEVHPPLRPGRRKANDIVLVETLSQESLFRGKGTEAEIRDWRAREAAVRSCLTTNARIAPKIVGEQDVSEILQQVAPPSRAFPHVCLLPYEWSKADCF